MNKLFFGGVHPKYNKEMSTCNTSLQTVTPNQVIIPMQQHIGAPCIPLVQVGDYVKRGQKIGDSTAVRILTNEEIAASANLKLTRLYDLAIACGIEDAEGFVQHFIDYEREVVRHEG